MAAYPTVSGLFF